MMYICDIIQRYQIFLSCKLLKAGFSLTVKGPGKLYHNHVIPCYLNSRSHNLLKTGTGPLLMFIQLLITLL